jgi:hypothetical protein
VGTHAVTGMNVMMRVGFTHPTTLLLMLLAAPVAAQVTTESYAILQDELDGRIPFETLPQRAEPGFNLDAPIRTRGAWIGERFAGQGVTGALHDALSGRPRAPLSVMPGRAGRNLSVALHRGFGSNALFPLGPAGFPELSARGEGAVAVLFNRDQAAFGLRVHSDYFKPLGLNPPRGTVTLRLFNRKGALIAEVEQQLRQGINEIGLRRNRNIPDIAGFTITNTDPGGIAIDDILFQLTALTG